jgi:ppGpp synthetase/RelA/SpoT-type nucleotidyltranferase
LVQSQSNILNSYDSFIHSSWLQDLIADYNRKALLAEAAKKKILKDLLILNGLYKQKYKRSILISAEGRIKEHSSFFNKLYKKCINRNKSQAFTQSNLHSFYGDIYDLCGVRFSCAYYDEILPTIQLVRSYLQYQGYATQLDAPYTDSNYLDVGDENGYRSYHFYVSIPTEINIYGITEECLCEVQCRTELQHVWATKSHDLLYKNPSLNLDDLREDMRQLSNSLRDADHRLVRIRQILGVDTNYDIDL